MEPPLEIRGVANFPTPLFSLHLLPQTGKVIIHDYLYRQRAKHHFRDG